MVTYNDVIKQTLVWLQQNRDEWEKRYKGYLTKIANNANKQIALKPSVKKPLFIYTTVSNETKTNPKRYLRFMGQNVGSLLQKNGNCFLVICEKDFKNSSAAFSDDVFDIKPGEYDWEKSTEAKRFRDFFANYNGVKHNDNHEHTVESAFLTDLEKKKGTDKTLKFIQPVEIRGKRFQMPTPLTASNLHSIKSKADLTDIKFFKYAKQYGGGIDILARRRIASHTYITVIELKDKCEKNEPPKKAMYQAIAYATFIRELIRSDAADGTGWYNLFLNKVDGIAPAEVPTELVIKCIVAMPGLDVKKLDNDLQKQNLKVLKPFNNSKDRIELHFINLDQKTYCVKDYSVGL